MLYAQKLIDELYNYSFEVHEANINNIYYNLIRTLKRTQRVTITDVGRLMLLRN